jgi:hypothetical protein
MEAGQEPPQHALTLGGTFEKQIHQVDQQKGLEPSGRRALSDDEVSDLPTRLQDAASYRMRMLRRNAFGLGLGKSHRALDQKTLR